MQFMANSNSSQQISPATGNQANDAEGDGLWLDGYDTDDSDDPPSLTYSNYTSEEEDSGSEGSVQSDDDIVSVFEVDSDVEEDNISVPEQEVDLLKIFNGSQGIDREDMGPGQQLNSVGNRSHGGVISGYGDVSGARVMGNELPRSSQVDWRRMSTSDLTVVTGHWRSDRVLLRRRFSEDGIRSTRMR